MRLKAIVFASPILLIIALVYEIIIMDPRPPIPSATPKNDFTLKFNEGYFEKWTLPNNVLLD